MWSSVGATIADMEMHRMQARGGVLNLDDNVNYPVHFRKGRCPY